jgi:hypothetical protein
MTIFPLDKSIMFTVILCKWIKIKMLLHNYSYFYILNEWIVLIFLSLQLFFFFLVFSTIVKHIDAKIMITVLIKKML